MTKMTEAEAYELDELLTETTPTFSSGNPGVFARQKDMAVVLDTFSTRYLMSKAIATKRTPAEIISEMIKKDMQTAI
jgi:hypothetical protein